MSKRDTPAVIDFGDYLAKKGEEGKIIIKFDTMPNASTDELGDRSDFVIPAPATWSDEIMESIEGPVDQARKILGDDEYARFKAAGGNAMIVDALIKDFGGAGTPE